MFYSLIPKIILLVSILIFSLTFISLFGRYPYLELATHFRLQYLFLSAICLIFLMFNKNWLLSFLAIISIILSMIYIAPYYFPTNRQVKNVPTFNLKVMTANVENKNKNYDKLIQSVKAASPDILMLQELTQIWRDNVETLKTDYPYFKIEPRAGGLGLAIYSRYPLESAKIIQLDESTHPALLCKIKIEEKLLTLLTIHPPTPMQTDKFIYRNQQFAESAKLLRETPEPKLLIGDLNTTMWSPYFGDLVKDSGLRDVRISNGLKTSWISFFPAPFRIPIDHCLVSETIEIKEVKLGDSTGLDHLPLIVELSLPK